MRLYILSLLAWLLTVGGSFAQSVGWANWKYQDHELIWSTVYPGDSVGIEEMTRRTETYLTSRSYASNIKVQPGKVTADITGMIVDYKKYKITDEPLTRAVRQGLWYGRILYELKDNRYRVTFSSVAVDLGEKSAGVAGTSNGVAAGGSRSRANLQSANEIFVAPDEKQILNKEDIFTLNQFLKYELELKKSIVARGDF